MKHRWELRPFFSYGICIQRAEKKVVVKVADVIYICIGWLLIAIGICGCIIPLIPGPPIAFTALLLAKVLGNHTLPSHTTLLLAAVITIGVTVLDYVVPAIGTKRFNCSRLGTIGCVIGTVVGFFFLPFGVIVGPFFGALIGESVSGKNLRQASFGAIGALVGFLFGVIIKLACCGYIAYCFYNAVK